MNPGKNFALILMLVIVSLASTAQRSSSCSFKEIQQSYYENFNGDAGKYDEGSEFNQFRRWEKFWGPRLTGNYDFSKAVNQQRKYIQTYSSEKRSSPNLESNWVELGPKKNGLGGTGRIDAIAFHPTDTNTMYVGAPSGGAWVSYDAGKNWENLNTDYQLPFLGVSSIALDPENPDIIFLGTGDVDSEWTWSSGVYRSMDAGQTWQPAGLNNLDTTFTIAKILLHPQNQNMAFAATSIGIFSTLNRNAATPSWSKVYPSVNYQFEYVRNIVFHPDNPEVLFACGTDIISSTQNGQPGSWTRIATPGSGLDFTNTPWATQFNGEEYVSVCNLAIAPQGDFLYINCMTRDKPPPYNWQSASHFYFYQYDISAEAWTELNPSVNSWGRAPITGGRNEMAVSPLNSQLLYAGGIRPYIKDCSNPDERWKILNLSAHVDYHELVFSPWEENVLYVGTDGGLFKQDLKIPDAFTDGGSFKRAYNQRVFESESEFNSTEELNNGLGLATIYNLGSSEVDPDQVMMGCQDLGIFYRTGSKWFTEINNADGFQCLMDKDDQNLMYATVSYPYNGSIFRSGESFENPRWDFSMVGFEPVNESSWFGASLVADPFNNKTLFQARINLWKVDDASNSTPSDWYKITDVNTILPEGWNNFNSAIYALEIAPANPDYIYFSSVKLDTWVTDFNAVRVFRTNNGGGLNATDWTDITPPTSGNNDGTYFITDIAVSSANPEKIWVSYSGYLENYKVKMYDGNNWTDYYEGLPNLPAHCIVHVNGSEDALFVGTDVGVYFRDATMDQWEPFSENLPAVIVNWLEVNYTGQKLRAGTFGRGLWETSLPGKIFNTGSLETMRPEIRIFPNPGTGQFNISLTKNTNPIQLKIMNLMGRMIMKTHLSSETEIDITSYPKGVYFFHFETSTGSNVKKVLLK
jgi:hypothetical protein